MGQLFAHIADAQYEFCGVAAEGKSVSKDMEKTLKTKAEIVKALAAPLPQRIVYVSCDPATLARDAGVLAHTRGYRLRAAGVVDAGGAGLLELVRGVAAAVSGEALPEVAAAEEHPAIEAIHQELSRYRYCTVFLIEGKQLEREALEAQLEKIGDSLLVVGDEVAMKVHVHTDDPGAVNAGGPGAPAPK